MESQKFYNDLKVNMQSALNYYPTTKGAFLHVEVEKIDQTITNDLAVVAFQKYLDLANAKTPEEQKALQETVFGAYYSIALLVRGTDKPKAIEYLNKAMAINPTDHNALLLQKELSK